MIPEHQKWETVLTDRDVDLKGDGGDDLVHVKLKALMGLHQGRCEKSRGFDSIR